MDQSPSHFPQLLLEEVSLGNLETVGMEVNIILFSSYLSLFSFLLSGLLEEYLEFINSWKKEANEIQNLSQDMKGRLSISCQTIEGIRITSNHKFN